MTDIREWLERQLADDEQAVRETLFNDPCDRGGHWSDQRILAEVAAKRRILELHASVPSGHFDDGTPVVKCHNGCGWAPCDTVRLLAAPFKDRDGWLPEWEVPE